MDLGWFNIPRLFLTGVTLKTLIMRFIFFIIAMCLIAAFCSCTKTDYGYLNTDRRGLHKYDFWIDHYNKDTTVMGVRTLFEHKYEPAGTSTNIGVDWFLNCATDSIEHWYYKIDGVGYETKLKPSRIDTIWINYSK